MRWTIPLRISRRISNCADDVRCFFWDLRQSHAHTTNRPTGYPLDREHLAVEINAVAGAGTHRDRRGWFAGCEQLLSRRGTTKLAQRKRSPRCCGTEAGAKNRYVRCYCVARLLKRMVARDGIEPPTPAFSGPLTESSKWFEI